MVPPAASPGWRLATAALLLGAVVLLPACGPVRDDDVLLIGHRGSPLLAPENSLQGFETAYQQGADGIEFDVQYTLDGHNVVMHDETLDRTTSCTGPVRSLALDQIRTCTLGNGEPVVTLGEALAAVGDWFDLLFVEIKVPEDPPPAPELVVAQTDQAVATVLASGLADRIVLISYDDTALRHLAARRPDGVVGGWDDFTSESISNANRYDLPWVLMPIRTVEPWMGDIITGLHRQLAVYQVVTTSEFVQAIEGGSRAIMADSLTSLAAMLGRKPRDLPAVDGTDSP